VSEERENLAKLAMRDLSGVPVSRNRLVEYTRLNSRTVSSALNGIKYQRIGKVHVYKLAEALAAIIAYFRESSGGGVGLSEQRRLESIEKTRLYKIEADAKERDRIPIEEVRDIAGRFFGSVNAWIERVPATKAAKAELREELKRILEEIKP
jgi:hypothetical protein